MSLEKFIYAIDNKNIKNIKYFCKNHPELINHKYNVSTPLHRSVKISMGHSNNNNRQETLDYQKISHYLIKHGGNLNIENSSNQIVYDTKNKKRSGGIRKKK